MKTILCSQQRICFLSLNHILLFYAPELDLKTCVLGIKYYRDQNFYHLCVCRSHCSFCHSIQCHRQSKSAGDRLSPIYRDLLRSPVVNSRLHNIFSHLYFAGTDILTVQVLNSMSLKFKDHI